jgi:hypothetical protein
VGKGICAAITTVTTSVLCSLHEHHIHCHWVKDPHPHCSMVILLNLEERLESESDELTDFLKCLLVDGYKNLHLHLLNQVIPFINISTLIQVATVSVSQPHQGIEDSGKQDKMRGQQSGCGLHTASKRVRRCRESKHEAHHGRVSICLHRPCP